MIYFFLMHTSAYLKLNLNSQYLGSTSNTISVVLETVLHSMRCSKPWRVDTLGKQEQKKKSKKVIISITGDCINDLLRTCGFLTKIRNKPYFFCQW